MPAIHQVNEIVRDVKARLREGQSCGTSLRVEGYSLDDGWLTIMVVSGQPGVRTSAYSELMSQIERELRAIGIDQVLLLPVLED